MCSTVIVGEVRGWFFPNDTQVSERGGDNGPDIYSTTNASSATLSQRRSVSSPTGLYRCEISDSNNITQSLYVGIYTSNGGSYLVIHHVCFVNLEFYVIFSSGGITNVELTYDSLTLTLNCTATGGPVTDITWSRNGESLSVDGTTYEQTQTVLDTTNAIYENTLTLASEIAGVYSCQVNNSISSQTKSIAIAGRYYIPINTL